MKHTLQWLAVPLFVGFLLASSCTSKTTSKNQPVSENPDGARPSATPERTVSAPADNGENERTGIFINRREISPQQAMALAATYHYAPIPGHFWYDTFSGAWGLEGHEAVGFLLPGHDFGRLRTDASNGNTGVFINGREINMVEAARLQRTFGAVYQGHWWLDGRNGNYGLEGNPMPMGNILAALRAQNSGRGGDNFWSSATARGNSSGGCSYVTVDGATATSGCD